MAIHKELDDLKSEISDWWGRNRIVEILSYGKIDGEGQMVMIGLQVCPCASFTYLIEIYYSLFY